MSCDGAVTQPQPSCARVGADDLAAKLAEAKEELFNLRFQNATGQLDNTARLRAVRKDIARIYTVMRERELGIVEEVRGMTDKNQKDEAVTERTTRKTREGLVVSDKMDKTVVVNVEDRVKHALYGKVLRRNIKLKAHDEANDAGIGDRVLIMETRPLSATKRWRIVEILEKAK